MPEHGYEILYAEINFFSILLMAVILIHTFLAAKMHGQKEFAAAVSLTIASLLADTLSLLCQENLIPFSPVFFLFSKSAYFLSIALMCWTWMLYLECIQNSSFIQNRTAVRFSLSLVLLEGILLLANRSGRFFFYLDDSGEYHRGTLFALQYLFAYAYIIFAGVRLLITAQKDEHYADRKDLLQLAAYTLMPAAAGIVQYYASWLPVLCVTAALLVLLIYLNAVEQLISLDPLTHINNRREVLRSAQNILKNHTEETYLYLLMIDVNRFKQINDHYGHINGDKALVHIAEVLKKSCSGLKKRAVVGRFGGDEFMILIESKSEEEPQLVKKRIQETLKEESDAHLFPYQLSVSIGISSDKEHHTIAEIVNAADKHLYEEKRIAHQIRID